MALSIHRSKSFPSLPEDRHKNCLYLVKPDGSTVIDTYLVDGQGNAYSHFNEPRFAELFEKYSQSLNSFFIVETIANRDALNLQFNTLVFVIDATGDPSVPEGSALYFYSRVHNLFTKVFQSTGLDWNFLSGRPQSSPAEIDEAVAKSHSHGNKDLLDMLGTVNNNLYFKGQPVTRYLVGSSDW